MNNVFDCEGRAINIGQRVVYSNQKSSTVEVGIVSGFRGAIVVIDTSYGNKIGKMSTNVYGI